MAFVEDFLVCLIQWDGNSMVVWVLGFGVDCTDLEFGDEWWKC